MSATTVADPHLVRVEKGRATDEELAAVTALLLARAARRDQPGSGVEAGRNAAPWRRLERARTYNAPHSWQG
ncbi:acyl-CoA carboxylase epsilon subunit [Streptomyces sp. DSM 44917]|uniref:Acyl-CoA carboxylase epsilon subunit n=1 Tax=Streptomyces boetiae TaxID=3075541 RepID=A0ABU2L9K2_9ACTN|nr:acyl-CoA carboxylase epsilon subunit [Streptomyces sp. DSM 44917]MDT0308252.1 acyl-CoA carboxylase epsilon subunit [Streptomyces sp. DSM 44917]